ncbi:hypothetical protein DCO57_17895 [Labrenzia sp. 011]|nr:hypothetical protein DCO57_17895 [Labrenzia sp. 011]
MAKLLECMITDRRSTVWSVKDFRCPESIQKRLLQGCRRERAYSGKTGGTQGLVAFDGNRMMNETIRADQAAAGLSALRVAGCARNGSALYQRQLIGTHLTGFGGASATRLTGKREGSIEWVPINCLRY